MKKLPQILPKELLNILVRKGFSIVRQTGSHVRLHDTNGNKVTIAMHNKPLSKGTLLSILRQAQMKKEDL